MLRGWASLAVLLLCVPVNAEEVTRTLRAQLPAETVTFAVENLAGSMRVVLGSDPTVSVAATVHAERDELAGLVRIEPVSGDRGVPTLRVRYPVERYTSYRYPQSKAEGLLSQVFGGGSDVHYDGASVRVSQGKGILLYVDLEVRVPARALDGVFRNAVGPLSGQGLQGRLKFDSGNGTISLAQLRGDVLADTGSGDVKAREVSGSLSCNTGSGDCNVSDFVGERLRLNTGSGHAKVSAATVTQMTADTGSGSVQILDVDAEAIKANTGSGEVEIRTRGHRLKDLKADTGSGNVSAKLGSEAGFEAKIRLASGQIVNRYEDAQAIRRGDKEIVGYRRGDGHIRISVSTGSGSFTLEP